MLPEAKVATILFKELLMFVCKLSAFPRVPEVVLLLSHIKLE